MEREGVVVPSAEAVVDRQLSSPFNTGEEENSQAGTCDDIDEVVVGQVHG